VTAIGELLRVGVIRGELAERVRCGVLDREGPRSVACAAQTGTHRDVVIAVGGGDHPAQWKTSISSGWRGLAAHVADLGCRGWQVLGRAPVRTWAG